MRIVHFSDWHWSFEKVPEADIYVCTGDMICNFPTKRPPGSATSRWGLTIDPVHERAMQTIAIQRFVTEGGGFRQFLGSPDAPIVCVKGNHDFVPIKPLFQGCGPVHEVMLDGIVFDVLGMTFTGIRGIPWIYGTWDDEEARPSLISRARKMANAAVYLTHFPPSGIGLDGWPGSGYGLDEMLNVLLYRGPALHCFGHIHESGGQCFKGGDVLFSNAATTYNVIEGSPGGGWRDVSPL